MLFVYINRILYPLSFVLILITLGCSNNKQWEGGVPHAPIDEAEISAVIRRGMSKNALLERCGDPWKQRVVDETYELEYLVPTYKFFSQKTGLKVPEGEFIQSFIVVVSNNTVIGWRPHSIGVHH